MERRAGIEPAALAWKARVLPLYERREMRGRKLNPPELVTFISLQSPVFFHEKKLQKTFLLLTLY